MSLLPTHSASPSPRTSSDSSEPPDGLTRVFTTTSLLKTATTDIYTDSLNSPMQEKLSIPSYPTYPMGGRNTWGRRLELIGAMLISSRAGKVILTFFGLLLAGMIFFPTASEQVVYAQNATFTVLPLGDSITWGYGAADGNGYRKRLKALVPELEFVGTQRSGNMTNPQTESYPGARVHDIAMKARVGLTMRPDIILLMIGTNDFQLKLDEFTTPKKMEALLEDIDFIAPESLLIVATLTPQQNPSINEFVKAFNRKLPGIITARQKMGKRVLLVDMYPCLDDNEPFDEIHPADKGYDRMADVWYNGLEQAVKRGWI